MRCRIWFSTPIGKGEDGQKRKPTLAFKYAWVMIKGTKEIRVRGGLQWTVEARLGEYLHFVAQKVDSARNSDYLRERASAATTHRVFIVPFARKGCSGRSRLFTRRQARSRALPDSNQGQEQIRLWDFPSRPVLYWEVLPAVNLIFADSISATLYHVNTLRVNMCAHFAKLKAFACMGACIAVAQSEVEYKHPLGGKIHVIHQRTFRMPMTQSAIKYVSFQRQARAWPSPCWLET